MSDKHSNGKTSHLHNLFDLEGQVAIVTGGSRGLGLQIAEALGEFGARPLLVSRKRAELEEAREHLKSIGIEADILPADLRDGGAGAEIAAEILRRHGRIDILVNNAGATWGAPAETHPLDAWRKVIDLNVTGLFALTQAVAALCFIPARRGAVINVASIEGMLGHHPNRLGTIAYNTAKGAVVNMTRALAAEWGPYGIRVNAIAPGFFPSKMTNRTLEDHEASLVEQTPLGKLGGEDDMKGAALLLASRAGGHITGQVVVIDGGASII